MTEIGVSPALNYLAQKKLSPSVSSTVLSIGSENVGNSITLLTGDTTDVIFSIPPRSRSFINQQQSYLHFSLYHTSTEAGGVVVAPAVFAGCGQSFIRELTVTAGGQTIEHIQDYNVLANLQYDIMVAPDTRSSRFARTEFQSLSAGTRFSQTLPRTEATRIDIAIPLMSGILGPAATKYLCMHQDLGMQLTLRLESPNIVLTAATGTIANYTMYRPMLQLEYVELEPSAWSQIYNSVGGVFTLPTSSWESASLTMPSGMNNTHLVPIRKSSCKSLLMVFRDSAYTAVNAYSVTSRCNVNLSTYSARIGGKQVPPVPVVVQSVAAQANPGANAFMHLMKCFHAVSDTQIGTTTMAYNTFFASTEPTSGFAIGIELEGETHVSNTLFSGPSTLSDNIFVDTTHHTASGIYTSTAFVNYDMLVTFNLNDATVSVLK